MLCIAEWLLVELRVNHDKPKWVSCSQMTMDDVMDLLAIFSIKDLFTFLARQIANSKITSCHQWKNLLVSKVELSQLNVTREDEL